MTIFAGFGGLRKLCSGGSRRRCFLPVNPVCDTLKTRVSLKFIVILLSLWVTIWA
ncbi:hypothetical protein AALP_AA2G241400 [Arabis alpina]|uniref:Uncharacterized protein n=1 Tax=Arabis alpina TaxID=50452 RepID=A0A087HJM2_ARAAL|nr:hypothetical protein AALP_AA2G241400 [Arabis alpina]